MLDDFINRINFFQYDGQVLLMDRQIDLLANNLHITPDGGERVAHFMRHACHQFTQRGESLRLRQTALRLFTGG